MNETHFRAPWSTSLRVISICASLVLAGVGLGVAVHPESPGAVKVLVGGIVFVTLAVNALFSIRGYALGDDTLYVKRLIWWSRIGLAGLRSVKVDRDACRRSIRLFGNGGLFAFAGLYRNKKLGSYRLCATDLKRTVVLNFSHRTWVVSPENPEEFALEIQRIARLKPDPPGRSR